MKNIISLGAGVQSSTMALMATKGEITPMPDCAIFADTQAEPKAVYDWLDWLEKQLPFPVYRVTKGNLEHEILQVRQGKNRNYIRINIPVHTINHMKKKGMALRQCTGDFKVVPIMRKIREIRNGDRVTQWIGISYDETQRMKPARVKYITNIFPLIDKKMRREDCLKWMLDNGYPKPPRSACYFCPFHNKHEWLNLTDEDKRKAEKFELKLQELFKSVPELKTIPFLTATLKPISEFFNAPKEVDLFDGQFNNECEGMCGV